MYRAFHVNGFAFKQSLHFCSVSSPRIFLVFQLRTFKVGFSGPKTFRGFEKQGPDPDIFFSDPRAISRKGPDDEELPPPPPAFQTSVFLSLYKHLTVKTFFLRWLYFRRIRTPALCLSRRSTSFHWTTWRQVLT